MLRMAIGLLLILSGSTGQIALIGNVGCKTMIMSGILLIVWEYAAMAWQNGRVLPNISMNRRRFSWPARLWPYFKSSQNVQPKTTSP